MKINKLLEDWRRYKKIAKKQMQHGYHPEGSVWKHVTLAARNLPRAAEILNDTFPEYDFSDYDKQLMMYASYLHDVGKLFTAKWNKKKAAYGFPGHEEHWEQAANSLGVGKDIRFDKGDLDYLIKNHSRLFKTEHQDFMLNLNSKLDRQLLVLDVADSLATGSIGEKNIHKTMETIKQHVRS